MSKDYEQISGSENMSDTDKSYFEHFGDEMYDQVEVVLSRHNMDIETMKDECVCFMNTLAGNPFEYLVEGAPLVCSMQTDEEQILRDGDGEIASNPELGYIKDISKLRITDDRRVTFAEYTPATVKDTKGGLRDVEKGLNIVSFGNCQCIKKKDLELLARELYTDTKIKGLEEKMRNAILERKGTCYCYMKLNPEWENLPLGYDFETESYVGNSNSVSNVLNSFSAGISQALNNTYQMFNGEQGINMMSILFCQRGGIITPWESGQKVISIDERYIRLLNRIEERTGRLEDYKLEFVKSIFPLLLVEEEKSGIPLEVMFAQMCCESKYGSKAVGNNYFGLKGEGTAGSVIVKTQEEVDGVYVTIDAKFRAYNSMEESIEDYVNVLTNVYQQYTTTGTIEDWFDALVEGGYATNSNYKGELTDVCIFWRLIIE